MSNPFSGSFIPYDCDLALLDRDKELYALDNKCAERPIKNYRIIAPRGMGKSTLLERFFTPEKCQELAEQHTLVSICRFSGDEMRTDADVMVCLIEAVKDTLMNLDPDSSEYDRICAEFEKIEKKHPNYATTANEGDALLMDLLRYLQRRRYYVTLILDEFHQLACAKNLADSTFSKMARLGQKNLISYIVASDYDDEVGSETYYISPFSRIFSDTHNEVDGVITPEGRQALMDLVRRKLSRYKEVTFSDQELETVLDLTNGIPQLIQYTLRDLFEIKREMGGELTGKQIAEFALSACTPLMDKWVQYFDIARWKTMEAVINEVRDAAISAKLLKGEDKLISLSSSGLVRKSRSTQTSHVCCPLFERYIRNELPRVLTAPAEEKKEQQVFQTIYVEAGATMVQTTGQGAVNLQQNHLHQGVTVSEILKLLGSSSADTRELFGPALAKRLREGIAADKAPHLLAENYATVEEYEEAYDKAFDQYSQGVVQDLQEDEDQNLVISPAEIETLESRFQQARSRYRSNLTDEFLAKQSERCRFYLKLSVIVEDALELPGIQLDDYSPQLVLYGKALEQSLRDNFYPLFHKEQQLSKYNTKRNNDPKATFGAQRVSDTNIGGYAHLISGQKSYLAGLCLQHPIALSGSPVDSQGWTSWWWNLADHIHKAREIRNLADHASPVSPVRADLDKMCDLLLGTPQQTGILQRNSVGDQLTEELIVPDMSFAVQQQLINQTRSMKCKLVKSNGGVRGVTCQGKYPVNIPKSRVQAFRKQNQCEDVELKDRELMVRILAFKNENGSEYFDAEIVSLVD